MLRSHPTLLRVRRDHELGRATFIELFFDLVFVFAVTQLSHTLLAQFTLVGAVETLVLLVALWWVWINTTWAMNWLDPNQVPVRLLLLALMLLGLLFSAAIPQAFHTRGLAFAVAYVLTQLGLTMFMLWAFRHNLVQRRNFQRILAWHGLSWLFWIMGGLTSEGSRLGLWSFALVVETVAPAVGFWMPGLGRSHTRDWNIEGRHFAERCGLFIILALGESIVITGATFSGLAWTAATIAAFGAAAVSSIALWWLYFDTVAEIGSQTLADAPDPGRVARGAYTYVHLFIVAGIMVSAVGDEVVLTHPTGANDARSSISVLGGPALYLLGNLLFKWAIARRVRSSHLLGMGVLVVLIAVADAVSPVTLISAVTVLLVGIAIWEAYTKRRHTDPRSVDAQLGHG